MSTSVSYSGKSPLRSWSLSAAGRGDLALLITTKEGSSLYQGRVNLTGRADGRGFYSDTQITCYGNWISGGLIEGFVKRFFSPDSGEVYLGRWTLYGANGVGALVLSPKRCYIGEWKDGKRDGFGTLKASKMVFIGTFKNDQIERGVMDTSVTGTARYIGEWAQKRPHGLGILKDSKDLSVMIGRWFSGEFQSGFVEKIPHFKNGLYTGEWGQNGPHGQGLWEYPHVVSYRGSWEGGEFHGQGNLLFPNGNYKQGRFDRQKFVAGKVRTEDLEGTIYEGEWKQGRFEGRVVVTFLGQNPIAGTFLSDGSWVPQSSCDISLEQCGPSPLPSTISQCSDESISRESLLI